MPDLLAGTRVRGNDTPATVTDFQPAEFSFTNTVYGVGTVSGSYADCAVVFTAPTTGRVLIEVDGRLANDNSTSGTRIAPVVRTGGVVGSGTEVESASIDNELLHVGTASGRAGVATMLEGLVPGATYNARVEHRVGSSTGTASARRIIVTPTT